MKPNRCGAEMALFLVALTYSYVGSQVGLRLYKARLLLREDLGCPQCHQLDERWVQFSSCAHEGRAAFSRGTQKQVGAKSSYISAKWLNTLKIQLELWETAVHDNYYPTHTYLQVRCSIFTIESSIRSLDIVS